MNTKFSEKIFRFLLLFIFVTGTISFPSSQASAQQYNPTFSVLLPDNEVHAFGWPLGSWVTLTIGDYTDTKPVEPAPWDPNQTFIQFRLSFSPQPEQAATMTTDNFIKTHIVTNLMVTSVDFVTDLVAGTANPGSEVTVGYIYCDQNGCRGLRRVPADEQGNWLADFSIPGEDADEQDIIDLTPGMGSHAVQCDEDGDCTRYGWHLPTPHIFVHVMGEQISVQARGWPLDSTVEMEISPRGTTYTATVSPVSWDPFMGIAGFELTDDDIAPGDIITITGSGITKTYELPPLQITHIDWENALISGVGTPGVQIQVCVYYSFESGDCISRYVIPDSSGNWTVNYREPGDNDPRIVDERLYQSIIYAHQRDGENSIWAGPPYGPPHIPNPTFSVRMTENEVHGYEWTFSNQVTLTVDDPTTSQSPDYTRTETVTFADWDPNQTFVQFRLWEDDFTLQPGMFVKMTDSSNITKTHTVAFTITDVDINTERVWGTGIPGTQLDVVTYSWREGRAIRHSIIAQDGTWEADFSIPGGANQDEQRTINIVRCGEEINASHVDEDGDRTEEITRPGCPEGPYVAIEHYIFNFKNPLLADLTIRRAIAFGTDRQRILNQAFLPAEIYGQLVNSPISPGNPYLAPASELTLYPYNPDEARALLANAGWVDTNGDGIREKDRQELAFTFKTTLNPMRTIAAQIFRENMEAIGIRITVIQDAPGDFFSYEGTLARGDFDIAEFAWHHSLTDPLALELYHSEDGRNVGWYDNPLYDHELSTFHNAQTEEERIAASHRAQAIFTADLPAFYLFTRENIVPHQTPTGTSVTLTPLPQVTITYTNVNEEGVTAALAVSLNPADLPQNMQLVDSPYEIGTTAMFETVKVCLAYRDNWMTPAQEAALRLYHYHNGVWADVTDPGSPDTVNNIVCGTATDFSLFAILLPLNQPPVAEAGPNQTIFFGSPVTLDASASSDPDGNLVAYEWDLNNDGQYDDAIGVTTTTTFDRIGEHIVGLRVTDDAGLIDTDTVTITVLPWTLKGFYPPVDMNGVYNVVKGGSTVPLKFEIFAGSTELTNMAYVKNLSYAETSCNANAITDEIELTATGGTSLRYDISSEQFIYNWNTPKTTGCYRVTLTTDDGSALVAYFKLK